MCNELKYGIWASTCILSYSFVSLFRQTYHTFINIPLEIYEVWTYSPDKKVDRFNFRDCNEVLKIELFKSVRDSEPHRIIAKSKDSLIFSEWFQYVLEVTMPMNRLVRSNVMIPNSHLVGFSMSNLLFSRPEDISIRN